MSLWEPPNLADVRVSYDAGGLGDEGIAEDPLTQFRRWWQDAAASDLPEPNAMVLATVDADGRPTTRMVLLKGFDRRGFVFFTNYGSRKAQQMAGNPHVSLCFPWYPLHRQVTVTGVVQRLAAPESAAYFRTRPRGSQLAAWASRQSEVIADRAALESRYHELAARWPDGVEPGVPDFWGGYLVVASTVEFWHGRESRLHDRLRFSATVPAPTLDAMADWQLQRISP
jgi:pyridoxamine 5'-phosphate oxidase